MQRCSHGIGPRQRSSRRPSSVGWPDRTGERERAHCQRCSPTSAVAHARSARGRQRTWCGKLFLCPNEMVPLQIDRATCGRYLFGRPGDRGPDGSPIRGCGDSGTWLACLLAFGVGDTGRVSTRCGQSVRAAKQARSTPRERVTGRSAPAHTTARGVLAIASGERHACRVCGRPSGGRSQPRLWRRTDHGDAIHDLPTGPEQLVGVRVSVQLSFTARDRNFEFVLTVHGVGVIRMLSVLMRCERSVEHVDAHRSVP